MQVCDGFENDEEFSFSGSGGTAGPAKPQAAFQGRDPTLRFSLKMIVFPCNVCRTSLSSEIAVSCVIEDKYAELAVRALHDAFGLGHHR